MMVSKNKTVADVFEKYLGTKEYDGIVATIQTWFYGKLVKMAWCATSMSWALRELGIMKYTIGEKEENVYQFDIKLSKKGNSTKLDKNGAFKRGDIICFEWGAVWSETASKHICAVYEDTEAGTEFIRCIGGNQNDSISIQNYRRDNIHSAYRPKGYAFSNEEI